MLIGYTCLSVLYSTIMTVTFVMYPYSIRITVSVLTEITRDAETLNRIDQHLPLPTLPRNMLSRRLAAARPLNNLLRPPPPVTRRTQLRCLSQADIDDPNMVSIPAQFTPLPLLQS